MLAAVLRARDERDHGLTGADEDDPEAVLHALLRLVEHNQRTPGLVELYCTLSAEATSPDHPAHEYFRQRYAAIVGLTCRVFEQLGARGRLRDGVQPQREGRALVALMDGLQVQWLLTGKRLDMVDDVKAHLRRVTTLELP
nr:TetR family transcriptional regulator C-terminal domain-containing protein [Kineococcus vitellinus]